MNEFSDKLINNYKASLSQKYNAVCFDIDGTITEYNSKKIDNRVIKQIAILLNKRVPIVFITGRGEIGLKSLIDEVFKKIQNEYGENSESLQKIFALTNDGARLFYTGVKDKEFLSRSTYIVNKNIIQKLNMLNELLIEKINNSELSDKIKMTYSKDNNGNNIVNIRIILINKKYSFEILKFLNEILSDDNYSCLNITKGVHEGDIVYQIGTTTKGNAIEKTEELIGIPRNSMLRIGDCGNVDGNDYMMLNCSQGFSVNEISKSETSCFPIIDENFNVLKGVEGTLYLLKRANILSTICLEKVEHETYKKGFAIIERQINRGRKKYLQEFDNIININFDLYDGHDGLFDKSTGSVYLPMYEWEVIADDNPLKTLWNNFKGNGLCYSLRDNENILLRGSSTYYYYLANRTNQYDYEHNKETDFTTKNNVLCWYNNNLLFFELCHNAINSIDNFDDIYNRKMILGILDNIRNFLLVCINSLINKDYGNANSMINFEKLNVNSILYNYYQILLDNNSLMETICFKEKSKINKEELSVLILKSIDNLLKCRDAFNYDLEDKDYSKDYRAYREIDNFAENYITTKIGHDKYENDIDRKGVCGLCYGGLELPFMYKVINKNIQDISLLKFSSNISSYKRKHSIEVRNFNINNYGKIKLYGVDCQKKYILADDNLLTAKTMQLAINTMYDIGIDVDGLLIVRYPSINRIDQMFLDNHGAVDYNYFFNFVNGLCFPSPYSWRDENDYNKYEDSLGIFDLNRRKILECLYKNHDYDSLSEVVKLRRKVKE